MMTMKIRMAAVMLGGMAATAALGQTAVTVSINGTNYPALITLPAAKKTSEYPRATNLLETDLVLLARTNAPATNMAATIGRIRETLKSGDFDGTFTGSLRSPQVPLATGAGMTLAWSSAPTNAFYRWEWLNDHMILRNTMWGAAPYYEQYHFGGGLGYTLNAGYPNYSWWFGNDGNIWWSGAAAGNISGCSNVNVSSASGTLPPSCLNGVSAAGLSTATPLTNGVMSTNEYMLAYLGQQKYLAGWDAPPMRFCTWYTFGTNVTSNTVMSVAMNYTNSGLVKYGWSLIQLDDLWQGIRDGTGKLLPHSTNFGSEAQFVELIRNLDKMGIKMGLYTQPQPYTSAGGIGSSGHMLQDATNFANWGVAFVKWDNQGATNGVVYSTVFDQLLQFSYGFHRAHAERGSRGFLYHDGISPLYGAAAWTNANLGHVMLVCDSIGVGPEITSYPKLVQAVDFNSLILPYTKRGSRVHFCGVYGIGMGLAAEHLTQGALEALFGSPCETGNLGTNQLVYMTNAIMREVNQNYLDPPVMAWSDAPTNSANVQVWRRTLPSGKTAVVVFNRTTNSTQAAVVTADMLGLPSGVSYCNTEAWSGTNTWWTNSFTATVPGPGSYFALVQARDRGIDGDFVVGDWVMSYTNGQVSKVATMDTNAALWCALAGVTNAAQKCAFHTFTTTLKASGAWACLSNGIYYPFYGSSVTNMGINLVNPGSYTAVITNYCTNSNPGIGLTGDGTNGYAATGFTVAATNFVMFAWVTNGTADLKFYGGSRASGNQVCAMSGKTGGGAVFYQDAPTPTTLTTNQVYPDAVWMSRSNDVVHCAVGLTTWHETQAISGVQNYPAYVLAGNYVGNPSWYAPACIQGFAISTNAMTTNQYAVLRTAVQTLNASLGR